MSLPPKPPVSPTLEIPPGLEAVYSNLARISHSPADIVIDFAHLLPADTNAVVKARVLMSPLSAKLLLRALRVRFRRDQRAGPHLTGRTSLPPAPGAGRTQELGSPDTVLCTNSKK